jgi:hypothetical protein
MCVGDYEISYCYSLCLEHTWLVCHTRSEQQTTNSGIGYGCIAMFTFKFCYINNFHVRYLS